MGVLVRLRMFGLMMVATLTLAFGAAGHAHHIPGAEDLRLEAYVLSGGDIASLCDGRTGHPPAMPGCPVCHLVGAALLPPPVDGFIRAEHVLLSGLVHALPAKPQRDRRFWLVNPLRGPPGPRPL